MIGFRQWGGPKGTANGLVKIMGFKKTPIRALTPAGNKNQFLPGGFLRKEKEKRSRHPRGWTSKSGQPHPRKWKERGKPFPCFVGASGGFPPCIGGARWARVAKNPRASKSPAFAPDKGGRGAAGNHFYGQCFRKERGPKQKPPKRTPRQMPAKRKGGGGGWGGATNQNLKKCAGFTHLNFEMEFLAASYGA